MLNLILAAHGSWLTTQLKSCMGIRMLYQVISSGWIADKSLTNVAVGIAFALTFALALALAESRLRPCVSRLYSAAKHKSKLSLCRSELATPVR